MQRRIRTQAWELDAGDPLAVPNATICLALIRCVRRLPGVAPRHSLAELGVELAPVFEPHRESFVRALEECRRTDGEGTEWKDVDLNGPAALQEAAVLKFLAQQLVHPEELFSSTFDAVEEHLEVFLSIHTHPFRRNVKMLGELVALPAAETTFLMLAAALCYGTVGRDHFSFVDKNSYLLKVLPLLCEARGKEATRLLEPNRPLAKSGLFPEQKSGRQLDLEDLLALTVVGERLVTEHFESAADMARAVLSRIKAPPQGADALHWPHLAAEKTLLRSMLDSTMAAGATGVNVLIHGGPGTGKTEFVRQLLAELDSEGFSVECMDANGREADRGERLASLRLGQAFTVSSKRAVLVFDEAEDVFVGDYNNPLARLFDPSPGGKAWMNALLENNARPVIWISNVVAQLDPAYLRRFAFCLEFPRTPFALRRSLAAAALGPAGCSAETIEGIASVESVTPALLAAAARFATLTRASGLSADAAAMAHMTQQLRASGHRGPPPQSIEQIRFETRYLNIAGASSPEKVLGALQSGLNATLQLAGPPGTGKTQFAHEIARRLGRQLLVRTASNINTKWYGESEANVARMFRDCDPASEVLFLDEADVLLGSRGATSHRADQAVTAEFLRWMETFRGTFVCATNHPELADAALSRRFTFRLSFLPLRTDQRREMYTGLVDGLSQGEATAEPTLSELRRLDRLDGLTPGDFANVRRRALALGLGPDACIEELELEHAAKIGSSTRIGFA